MFTRPKRRKIPKKRIVIFFIILIFSIACLCLVNLFYTYKKPLFISPLGETFTDLSLVKKILKENKIEYTSIVFSDYSYLITTQDDGQIKLSQDKDIVKQVSSLQKILHELTIEGKAYKSIDLRFSEPVVAF